MFNTANMAAERYKSAVCATIAAVMTEADPVAGTITALKPVIDGTAVDCKLSLITLLTVMTTVVEVAAQVMFSQTFTLPQGNQGVVQANLAAAPVIGYVGVDPLLLDQDTFRDDILSASG